MYHTQLLQPPEGNSAGLVVDPGLPGDLPAAHTLCGIQEGPADGEVARRREDLIQWPAKNLSSGSHGWLV